MFDEDVVFNRFSNLDSIEERIIIFLINSNSLNSNRIWKLLKYGDKNALSNFDLTNKERSKLIDSGDEDQSNFRIFKQSFLEDAFNSECSLLKFYIDSVIPTDHLSSIVNIGIDIMTHNKIQIVYNDAFDKIENSDYYREIEQNVITKNRNSMLLKCLLAELNGQFIEGIGQLQFNNKLSPFSQARMGIYNNRNYCGFKTIISCIVSGVN